MTRTESDLEPKVWDLPRYDGRSYSGGCKELPYGTWHVHVGQTGDEIMVMACDYCSADFGYLRRHGHLRDDWARLSRTHPKPSRLNKAIDACQKWCDRKNAAIAAAESAVKGLRHAN